MTDAAIAAPEAAPIISSPPPAPVDNATDSIAPDAPNPIKTTPEPAKTEVAEPKKPISIKDSIKAAEAKVNEAAKVKTEPVKAPEKPVEAKIADPVKSAAEAPKEPHHAPPKRFNAEESAEYDKAPDSVKKGLHRAVTELEKGLETYKKDSAEYGELKEFRELAKQHNVPLKDAIANYVSIEKALQSTDPKQKLSAIEEVLRVAKVTPQDYAAFISKQPVDQAASQTTQTINELRTTIQQLEQKLNGVVQTTETQQTEQAKAQLNEWAKDKPHAVRLADQIAQHYSTGLELDEAYAKAVSDAETLAKSMGFITPQPQPVPSNVTELAAHTLKASKSITGSSSAGSHLATQKPSTSIKEAIAKAIAQAG